MLKDMTRAKVIQIWLALVAAAVVASVVLGARVTLSTAAMLVAISLVPPAIVLLLWPGVQPPTAADVLHDVDRRA